MTGDSTRVKSIETLKPRIDDEQEHLRNAGNGGLRFIGIQNRAQNA
jgi:hypothetical protein